MHVDIPPKPSDQGQTTPVSSEQEQMLNSSSPFRGPFRDNLSRTGGSATSDQGNISVDISFLNDSPRTATGSIFDDSDSNVQDVLHINQSHAPSLSASVRSLQPSIGIMTSAAGVFQPHGWRPLPQHSPEAQDGLGSTPRAIPNGATSNATRGPLAASQFSGSPIVSASGLRNIWNNFPTTSGPIPFDDVPPVPTPIGTGRPSSTRSYGYSLLGDSYATDATYDHSKEHSREHVSPPSSLFSARTPDLQERSGVSSANGPELLTTLPTSEGPSSQLSPISDSHAVATSSLGFGVAPEDTERMRTPIAEPQPADMPAQVLSWRCRICMKDPCVEPTTTMCGHIFCHRCVTEI